MGDCPDLRKPGVEFCLGRVNKGLSVGVWFHENIIDALLKMESVFNMYSC
jgi:hypothetical protein